MFVALPFIIAFACAEITPPIRMTPAPQPTAAQVVTPIEPAVPQPTERQRVDKARRVLPAQAGVVLPADSVTVVLPIDKADLLDPKMRTGRIIIFFRALDSRAIGAPSDGPFFEDPQPLGSVQVDAICAGTPIEFAQSSVWWPGGPELLEGQYEVQAVLDVSDDERGHLATGNLLSAVVTVDLHREATDAITLELTEKIAPTILPDMPTVQWIDLPSPLLSAAVNRSVTHRAGVILPPQYHDIHAKRRIWPTIYVIPGFGGRFTSAAELARKMKLAAQTELWPNAVYVILDPESAFGHHGFVDSTTNGPRGQALVSELIPYLEDRFRLIRDPSARVLTGHSSGGWTSVWLALRYPQVFGAAFASAPDPLDFSAFQMSDLYKDDNLFVSAQGEQRPSFREPIGPQHDLVPMCVGDEVQMEWAMSPRGASGEQWDAWAAMFSPVAEGTRQARRLCDPLTGVIDPVTIEAWSKFDIARLISKDWNRTGRLFVERVRIIVGERDSFYLERAAIRLRDAIALHTREQAALGKEFPRGPGYIEIVPGATHDTVYRFAQLKFSGEIRAYLKGVGHHE